MYPHGRNTRMHADAQAQAMDPRLQNCASFFRTLTQSHVAPLQRAPSFSHALSHNLEWHGFRGFSSTHTQTDTHTRSSSTGPSSTTGRGREEHRETMAASIREHPTAHRRSQGGRVPEPSTKGKSIVVNNFAIPRQGPYA